MSNLDVVVIFVATVTISEYKENKFQSFLFG